MCSMVAYGVHPRSNLPWHRASHGRREWCLGRGTARKAWRKWSLQATIVSGLSIYMYDSFGDKLFVNQSYKVYMHRCLSDVDDAKYSCIYNVYKLIPVFLLAYYFDDVLIADCRSVHTPDKVKMIPGLNLLVHDKVFDFWNQAFHVFRIG